MNGIPRFRALCLFLLIVLSPLSVSSGDAASAPGHASLRTIESACQVELDSLARALGIPGATAAYILPDGSWKGLATGAADPNTGEAMTADRRMLAGEVAESFLAAVVLDLAREGKLSLDDGIGRWLGSEPWFSRVPNGNEITLRMLLLHTSGLPDPMKDSSLTTEMGDRSATTGGAGGAAPLPEVIECMLERGPFDPPGATFHRSRTGTFLVTRIIEKASGDSYSNELRRRFLHPFGLFLTLPAVHRDIPGMAIGSVPANNPWGLPAATHKGIWLSYDPKEFGSGAGVATNPMDLVRWARLLYEGQAIDGGFVENLLPAPGATASMAGADGLGLGMRVEETPIGIAYGHEGHSPGYQTYLAYYPNRHFGVAAQVSRDCGSEAQEIASRLSRTVLDRLDPSFLTAGEGDEHGSAPATSSPTISGCRVQLGAFSDTLRAAALVKGIDGPLADLLRIEREGSFFKVFLGGPASLDEARLLRAEAKDHGFQGAWVTGTERAGAGGEAKKPTVAAGRAASSSKPKPAKPKAAQPKTAAPDRTVAPAKVATGARAKGYEVQVFVTTDSLDAADYAVAVRTVFHDHLYIKQIGEHYAVRVGRAMTREEARRTLDHAKTYGFEQARIESVPAGR